MTTNSIGSTFAVTKRRYMDAVLSSRGRYHDPAAIFATTTAPYVRYRPPHPRVLVDYVADLVLARGSTRAVMDLGCGPGAIALHLAQRGIEVVAVDPNTDMLAAGQQLAARFSRQRSHSSTPWLPIVVSGADVTVLARSLGLDPRIGPHGLALGHPSGCPATGNANAS